MNDITVISGKTMKGQKLKELWKYREVFYYLAWKDIVVRYKQTVLGVFWAIIQPLLSMLIMTFIFGNVAKLPSNGVPYPILVYSAMIPWYLFSSGFANTANSLIGNSNLLTKVYFPRLALPTSAVVTSFIDAIVSLAILLVMMIGYRYMPPIRFLLMPIFFIMAFCITLGAGLFVATMNVKYRDIKYIVPFIVQFGMYISPVGYSSNVIPEKFKLLYSLNPLVGVIDGFRWCFIPYAELYLPSIFISAIVSVILLFLGVRFFNKFEQSFADII
ncbi:ABC transporter permease [Clostridium polyendosporum]|nr:ABC transporter permease [Clostridium polyendosporum]